MNQSNKALRDCWLWAGIIDKFGYGVIHHRVSGVNIRQRAHRVMYENFVGEIPEGLVLDHLCRVRHCVNPSHLEPVTQKENVMRGIGLTSQNARKTHCLRGHAFTAENTYWMSEGWRSCKECLRIRDKQQKLKNRLARDRLRQQMIMEVKNA